MDRAGDRTGAPADHHLPPARFGFDGHDEAFGQDFDPARAIGGLLVGAVEAGDFRAAQTSGEADEQNGPVADTTQTTLIKNTEHGLEIVGQEGLFLDGRPGMGAADAGHHQSDMAIRAVQRVAPLGKMPGERREAPFEGRDGSWLATVLSGRAGRQIETERRRMGQGSDTLTAAPGRKMLPVHVIGAGLLREGRRQDRIRRQLGQARRERTGRGRGCRCLSISGLYRFVL